MLTRRTTLKAGLGLGASLLVSQVEAASQSRLPALPLPAGAKVMGFGHSMIQRQAFSSPRFPTSRANSLARGALTWARASDGRYNIDIFANPHHPYNGARDKANFLDGAHQAIGGGHTVDAHGLAGTLTRTAYALDRRPDIVYLHIGENDVSSGVAANGPESLIANLDKQITLLNQGGAWVILQTLMHRTTKYWPAGDHRRPIVDAVNVWIKAQSGRHGVKVCDTTALGFNDPNWNVGLFGTDGTHMNPTGALRVWTEALRPVLESMVAAGNSYDMEEKSGNLWPGAALLGSSGKCGGKIPPTGEVADGWIAFQTGGSRSRIVCSKEAGGPGFEKQVLAITPDDDDDRGVARELHLRCAAMDLAAVGLAPGDWIEAYLHVELSDWPAWLEVNQAVETFGNGGYRSSDGGGLSNPDSATQSLPIPRGGGAFWIKNRAFQIPDQASAIRLDTRPISIKWLKSGRGTGVVKISQPVLRKLDDPRRLWNL